MPEAKATHNPAPDTYQHTGVYPASMLPQTKRQKAAMNLSREDLLAEIEKLPTGVIAEVLRAAKAKIKSPLTKGA
jgi:hypothetical protein